MHSIWYEIVTDIFFRNPSMQAHLNKFKEIALTADLSGLGDKEREIISLWIDVADLMDEIFWLQSYGDPESLLQGISNEQLRHYSLIHFGPWDRISGNEPFVEGYGKKAPGARFYPTDMSVQEFEALADPSKTSPYTLIGRDQSGGLVCIPYDKAYEMQHREAARLLRQSAALSDDLLLKNYLMARAEGFISNEFQTGDLAWMKVHDCNIDLVVGPTETYEDRLFGYKAAHQAYILVKDHEWSNRFKSYNDWLPELQAGLPVPEAYKAEIPATGSGIGVYDVVYYAGDCNAGTKTIAVNLPNDPEIHQTAGSRKLQFKNAMKAKFDNILAPIARLVIHESQVQHVTFDAFFDNVTFHEVAHGMGLKHTVPEGIPLRIALREYYNPIEEAKADIMGLYLITRLSEKGKIPNSSLLDNYVTFFAGIFRSLRFGVSSAHGQANMIILKYFFDKKACEEKPDGTFLVHFEAMQHAVTSLVAEVLLLQGGGNIHLAKEWLEECRSTAGKILRAIEKINSGEIPVDLVFRQGREVLQI